MKNLSVIFIVLFLFACVTGNTKPKTNLTKQELQDKIKGGWAGQVIGCTYGGPTEFHFNGTMINDYQPIAWDETRCLWYYQNSPGLYDDLYMDLTFVSVFEKEGLDASANAHALAFANAEYPLWHANQAARYNILNGIMPPESGNWLNNPHADDIDFQIEADFAGLMSPGMVNTASGICDKIGHIMNSGDGWYGGVYVAALYSLAFVSNDIEYVVTEALKTIPAESEFYQCINDVIKWHSKFPNDWKQTWFEVERKWSADIGCPYGVFHNFNIDAKINAAYVVIGLLYGKGDFSKTLEIATRCGQDSDCNPASAGGILGTILGYSNIPEVWKKGVYPVEDLDFKYTSMSLNVVYEIGTKHAMQIILKNGGKIDGENITLPLQDIHAVPLEVNFKGHFPVERREIKTTLSVQNPALTVEFSGNGFVLTGGTKKDNSAENMDMQMQMVIDGGTPEPFILPTDYIKRNQDVIWKYQLPKGKHKVEITFKNPKEGYQVNVTDLVVYSSRN